ncbi:MAG TPA: endonuclease/exonuclease/phosphatase family protein [Kiritimatiellia bacterium]|nr:endonuclease/exonuclease/phosphatase family protein [Kiritimatiellia bacterium]HSA19497.1 endonuclease/exonuclease/phosphatase family protein [Kiritimatiellia bacterium]
MNTTSHARKAARRPARAGLAGCLLLLASCGRAPEPPPPAPPAAAADETFSVMSFNLHLYGLADRTGTGRLEPKPDEERAAVVAVIARERPDILAVQEIGDPSVLAEFRDALARAGLDYPHAEYLQRGQSELNLAVLSRFPITDRQPHVDDQYTLGQAEVLVLRGFLDVEIEVGPEYRFRLLGAHLKSKVFHALGQTEMRRNEARLLNKHIRGYLKDRPDINLLVVGDFNDTPASAALREVMGSQQQYARDLRPPDEVGDVWTYFSPGDDNYSRIDYMLASEGMWPETVVERTRAIRHPLGALASDHRAILGVFRARECAPSGPTAPAPSVAAAEEPAETAPVAPGSSGSDRPSRGPPP